MITKSKVTIRDVAKEAGVSPATVSGVWIKEVGEWRVCPERDFDALEVIATMLRKSPSPEVTRMRIAKVIAKIREGFDL